MRLFFISSIRSVSVLAWKSLHQIGELSLQTKTENALHTHTNSDGECCEHWTINETAAEYTSKPSFVYGLKTLNLFHSYLLFSSLCFSLKPKLKAQSRAIFDCYLLERTEIHQLFAKWYLCTLCKLHFSVLLSTYRFRPTLLFVSLSQCQRDKPDCCKSECKTHKTKSKEIWRRKAIMVIKYYAYFPLDWIITVIWVSECVLCVCVRILEAWTTTAAFCRHHGICSLKPLVFPDVSKTHWSNTQDEVRSNQKDLYNHQYKVYTSKCMTWIKATLRSHTQHNNNIFKTMQAIAQSQNG